MAEHDHLSKLLNTAIIATKIPLQSNYSAKFRDVVQSDGFDVILRAIEIYAKEKGISEEIAAQTIVQTFRSLDELWDGYIYQEGLDRLKNHLST